MCGDLGDSAYLAHSANLGGRVEPTSEHVAAVASRAAEFASAFGAEQQARVAGLLHDLGKYSERFLNRVTGKSTSPAGNHAIAGAIVTLSQYGTQGLIPAAAILGHHGGMEVLQDDWRRWATDLAAQVLNSPDTVTHPDLKGLLHRFGLDGFELPPVDAGLQPCGLDADDLLDTRMLFSALVDADFLETEAHFAGDQEQPRRYRTDGPLLEPARALAAVQSHLDRLRAHALADPHIHAARQSLQNACLAAADEPTGLYTLASPTGSGKTLAMLAFALRHALVHGLRRIVLVMPFLNIIDQTAALYHSLFTEDGGFPEPYVLEHHSLAERHATPDDDDQSESHRLRRLLAENWDAPIILTTSVQFLESLMSNRPSACRKLHRLANSVVLFDEVQTLPRDLAVATLGTLSRLSRRYNTTVLLATATQPAFEHLDAPVRAISSEGWHPASAISEDVQTQLYGVSSSRTAISWEHGDPRTLDSLADCIAASSSPQSMCIVNLKRHAQRLAELLRDRGTEGLLHLSTTMCPMHRQAVLDRARQRLDSDAPITLVATQCVEAGVDIDFPVVHRAMAPLDSIAQAAGRCNRHGRRPVPGEVHVFKPCDDEGRAIYPPGYQQAAQITESFVNRKLAEGIASEALIHDPAVLGEYFRELYVYAGTATQREARADSIREAMREGNFRKVADLYRLITQDAVNVLVPYDEERFEELRAQIQSHETRRPGELRRWITAARALSVAPYKPKCDAPIWQYLDSVHFCRAETGDDTADWWLALPGLEYDSLLGLKEPEEWQTIV